MSEPAYTTAFTVLPPFDSESGGDCILRTPDGTEFKVFKIILGVGSSVFSDMFGIPQAAKSENNETGANALPVIPIEEDPETVKALLQMLYPLEPPEISSLNLARKLVIAGDKYFVNTAKLGLCLRDTLSSSQSLKEDPVSCYALSWRVGLEKEAIAASGHIRGVELADTAVTSKIMSQSRDANALVALWDLYMRREKDLDTLLAMADGAIQRDMACRHHDRAKGEAKKYMERKEDLRKALSIPYPTCHDVERLLGFTGGKGPGDCSGCEDRRSRRLLEKQIEVAKYLEDYPQTIKGFPVN